MVPGYTVYIRLIQDINFLPLSPDVHLRRVLRPELEGQPPPPARQHDLRVSPPPHRVAHGDMAARLVLQERQERHLPDHDHPQPLHLAVEGQDHSLHGQVSVDVR